MKISLFWLFCAVEGGRYYAKMKAQKAAAKTQMMIRDADGVSFLEKISIFDLFSVRIESIFVIFDQKRPF